MLWLGFGLGLVFGWFVVMHTNSYHFSPRLRSQQLFTDAIITVVLPVIALPQQ